MELSLQAIGKISSITPAEMQEFVDREAQIEQHIVQDLMPREAPANLLALEEYKQQLEKDSVNIEYLRNVVTKYLEYLAVGNTKEVHTLESVIFTVLKVQKAQMIRIQKLREKNTFWRKWMYQKQAANGFKAVKNRLLGSAA